MIATNRQSEIDSASPENPVRLTAEEVAELRIRNRPRFQRDVGAGCFLLPAKDGSSAHAAHQMHNDGRTNAEIGNVLGRTEDQIEGLLSVTYLP